MARETLPVAPELTFGDEAGLQHSPYRFVSLPGAHKRRIAMRPAERVKIIEWVSTIVSVAMLAVLLIATLS
jgi:hypothetical protein